MQPELKTFRLFETWFQEKPLTASQKGVMIHQMLEFFFKHEKEWQDAKGTLMQSQLDANFLKKIQKLQTREISTEAEELVLKGIFAIKCTVEILKKYNLKFYSAEQQHPNFKERTDLICRFLNDPESFIIIDYKTQWTSSLNMKDLLDWEFANEGYAIILSDLLPGKLFYTGIISFDLSSRTKNF
jgi:hypothetical protein